MAERRRRRQRRRHRRRHRGHQRRSSTVFPLSRPGAGPRRAPPPPVTLGPPLRFTRDPDADFIRDARGRFRGVRVPKPRVPWARRPRRPSEQIGINCGNRTIRWRTDPGAQVRAAWVAKNCAGRRGTREFNAGGPEAGTLAGARRAEGLFDAGWGTDFPLTRREQKALQEGTPVPDPFFAPPTTPNPGNYIADRLELLRRRFGPTEYSTAQDINGLCGPGGSGITCEGPDGGISWTSTSAQLTKEDMARFRAAYCDPKTCQTPGSASPPAGFTEKVIKGRPANPGTARRVRCTPEPAAEIVGPKLAPLPPLPAGDPAAAATGPACVDDVILGRDDGPFASGWWIVLRGGQRALVPNPLTCPT